MPQITNTGRGVVRFREKGGKVVEIAPGQTKPVDIDRKHREVVAHENARLIRVGGSPRRSSPAVAAKTAPAPAAPATE